MIRQSLTPLALCACLLLGGSAFAQRTAADQQPDLAQVNQQILNDVNSFRAKMGRKPLKENPALTKAAQYFAQYLADHDELSHTADGSQPWDRAKKFGYDYCMVEENIAFDFNSEGFTAKQLSEGLVKGWENSPGHRKNMLNPDVDETGIAVARSGKSGKFYAVQEFGRPKSEAISFSIANRTDAEAKYKVNGQEFTLQPGYTQRHQVCSPPKLSLASGGQEFHPENGARFTIRAGSGGANELKRQ